MNNRGKEKAAFPFVEVSTENHGRVFNQGPRGITNKEYFVGQALTGLISNSELMSEFSQIAEKIEPDNDEKQTHLFTRIIGNFVCRVADGVLESLEKDAKKDTGVESLEKEDIEL